MRMTTYNYTNFKADHFNFTDFDGPKQSEKAPDFTAHTIDGAKVRLSDYFGTPIVLETGSVTCPIYVGEIKEMQSMAQQFPKVQFLVLYVREAHPGEKIGPHADMVEKISCAKRVQNKHGEERTILVDDVDGTAHKLYGLFPDSVYLIDSKGVVAWRTQWNRTQELRENIQRLLDNKETIPTKKKLIDKPERIQLSVLLDGGWIAVRDFITQFPALVWYRIFKR